MSNKLWHTSGVVDMKVLENNKVGLKFTGEDGTNRALTIPVTHTLILACALFDLAEKASKTHEIGDTLTNLPNLRPTAVSVGEARDGSAFSLLFQIGKNAELQVPLSPETTESLAAGLIEVLRRHGRTPQDLKGAGTRH